MGGGGGRHRGRRRHDPTGRCVAWLGRAGDFQSSAPPHLHSSQRRMRSTWEGPLAVPTPVPQSAGVHVCVCNIPGTWAVADVRNFFTNAVEASWFTVFHYLGGVPAGGPTAPAPPPTRCVVRIKRERVADALKLYDGRNWVDAKGEDGVKDGSEERS